MFLVRAVSNSALLLRAVSNSSLLVGAVSSLTCLYFKEIRVSEEEPIDTTISVHKLLSS
jgi:hypothetical protein